MKTKKILLAIAAIGLGLGLASCGEKTNPTPTPTPDENLDEIFDGFESAVSGTVKMTYEANYDVDVDANGGSANMSNFKHKIRAKSIIEMDLGTDLYIKVTKTKKDLLVSETEETKTEALLYKNEGKYYYVTTSSSSVEIETGQAKEKISSIFTEMTEEQAGILTLDSLIYKKGKKYELDNFGFTDTFVEADLADPSYKKNSNNGITVTYKPEYIGYHTDGGWSDFKNDKDGYAATVTLETNSQGFVTSSKEEYNTASLDFAIMTPAPTVKITGSRSFTASYGETITKATELDTVKSTVTYSPSEGGTFEVKTCGMGDFQNMMAVENGGALELGKLICVKPNAAEGKEVDKVLVNDSETTLTPPAQAGGWYCFNVKAGVNTVVVTFKEGTPKDDTKGIVTIPSSNKAKIEVFTCAPFGFANMTPVGNGGEVTVGNWICVKVTPAEGNTITSVKLNESAQTLTPPAQAGGYYCFTATAENEITIEVAGEGVLKAQLAITNESNIEYTLTHFVYAGAPGEFLPVENNEIVPGASIFGAVVITPQEGKTITVTVNGTPTTVNIPNGGKTYYCFPVKTADTYTIVITIA